MVAPSLRRCVVWNILGSALISPLSVPEERKVVQFAFYLFRRGFRNHWEKSYSLKVRIQSSKARTHAVETAVVLLSVQRGTILPGLYRCLLSRSAAAHKHHLDINVIPSWHQPPLIIAKEVHTNHTRWGSWLGELDVVKLRCPECTLQLLSRCGDYLSPWLSARSKT